jgi:hypothetical protein
MHELPMWSFDLLPPRRRAARLPALVGTPLPPAGPKAPGRPILAGASPSPVYFERRAPARLADSPGAA